MTDERARLLEQRLRALGETADPDRVRPRADRSTAPLSFGQQRLWFLDRWTPGSPLYNAMAALRLRGPVRADALRWALSEIAGRHEVLRTVFPADRGGPAQLVLPPAPVEMPVADVSHLPAARREDAARELALAEVRRPFDLEQGPLLRARLVRLAGDDHVALVTTHHIASDEWSLGVLFEELAALYDGALSGAPVDLPELPVQYADFAVWQRERLTGAVLERQLAYWRRGLAAIPATSTLHPDRPRPRTASFRGERCRFTVAADVAEGLLALSGRERVTLFMTLLTAFNVLVYRWTGQDDLVVGSPVAGRVRPELEGLVGFFVNMLVLRTGLGGDPTFRTLLHQVEQTCLDAYDHQDLPFERLVEELQPERDPSRQPLVQVTFQLANTPAAEPRLTGLGVEPFELHTGTAKFDLSVEMTRTPRGLSGSVEYATDLFDGATIRRLTRHFQTLLANIVAAPDARLSGLDVLTEAERGRLLAAGTGRPSPAAEPARVHELVAAQARRTPNAIAITHNDHHLTYAQLDQHANQLAHHLHQHGAKPETLIAVLLDRTPDLITTLLAILKTGAAYLPLDPRQPTQRLTQLSTTARFLITDQNLDTPTPRIHLDTARYPTTPPAVSVGPHNLAYVIHTSGSTGAPKGVMITHANLSHLLQSTAPYYRFDSDDVWTLFHSQAFDFSVWEIWGCLTNGGRLVVVPYWVSRSPDDFADLLHRERVTVLNQTPGAFQQLTDVLADNALRTIVFGGEKLDLDILRPWFDRHGDEGPRITNMYGITETTVHATSRPIHADDLDAAPGSMIGEPIPGTEIHVLGPGMLPAPPGSPGEIYLAGAGLARGYLGQPALTAERFVPHPFARRPGQRLYRTGDRARRLPDGDIEYLGRTDDQLKIRGHRVEPGEIEAALTQHPQVERAVVIARESTGPLIAYLVAGEALDQSDLRGFLKEKLPEYMLPAAFVELESLPLTPNGKVDRAGLPAVDLSARPTRPSSAPRTSVEERLADIWREVLGVDRVGGDDDFFELGGNSLLAVQAIARVRERFGADLSVRSLFEYPTIREFGAELGRSRTDRRNLEGET